jgi:hypothetical protein
MLGGSWGAAQLTAPQEGLSSVSKYVSKCYSISRAFGFKRGSEICVWPSLTCVTNLQNRTSKSVLLTLWCGVLLHKFNLSDNQEIHFLWEPKFHYHVY